MKQMILGLTIAALIVEFILAIPILGGTIILAYVYTPLILAFIIHTIALVLRKSNESKSIAAPILGIVTSVLGFIPVLGWGLHLAAFIVYLVDISKGSYK